MKVQSSVMPDPFWIKSREQGKATVRLRRNIEEKTREGEEGTSAYYEYDEAEVVIPNCANLEQYIDEYFDSLWLCSLQGVGVLKGWQELQDEDLEAIIELLEEE